MQCKIVFQLKEIGLGSESGMEDHGHEMDTGDKHHWGPRDVLVSVPHFHFLPFPKRR